MTSDYALAHGTHVTPEDGRCAMEWVSYLANEPHGDEPICVSPVVRAICIALNDSLEPAPRQRLRPYLARTIGTADDGLDTARAWMAMDWLIGVYTPTWLRRAHLDIPAGELASLPTVDDARTLGPALESLEAARRQARAARAQAFGGARAIGWASAVAAGLTGRETAWTCAGAAAWAAARVGVGELAGDRARAAARATAGDAAAIAARGARTATTRSAAREAAREALEPTLEVLSQSALALLDRMLPTVTLPVPADIARGTGLVPALA
jgi:hypothetical protein